MPPRRPPHDHAHFVGPLAFFSDRAAASSQASAICKKIRRSRSDLAVLAQPRHSSANSRYSAADDMMRPSTEHSLPDVVSSSSLWRRWITAQSQIAAGSVGRRKPLSLDFGRRVKSGMMMHRHDTRMTRFTGQNMRSAHWKREPDLCNQRLNSVAPAPYGPRTCVLRVGSGPARTLLALLGVGAIYQSKKGALEWN